MKENAIEDQTAENRMGTAPVAPLLLKMALPIILSTLVQSLYNIVDGIFVAQISEEAMTAITYAQPPVIVLLAVGTGIAVGMNTMLSHALGEKNQKCVNDAAQTGIFLTVAASIISFAASVTLVRPYIMTQTEKPVILEMGVKYLRIYMALGIGTMGQLVFERMLISTGKTMYSMISQITGAVLNLVLDPILIFGLLGAPAMGISGAALATVLSQIAALIIALVLNLKKNHEVSLQFSIKPAGYAVRRLLFLGVPSTIFMTLNACMMLGINAILRSFSETAIAAIGACAKITTLFINVVNAMANTLMPMVAYNHGAKKKKRIDQALKYGYLYSLILTAAGTLVCLLFTRQILLMFNAKNEMMKIGINAMRLMSCGYMMLAIRNVSTAVVQALGHSVQSMIVDLFRSYVILLPFAWLFARSGNVNRVFWAYPLADSLTALVGILLLWYFYRKDIRTMQNACDV